MSADASDHNGDRETPQAASIRFAAADVETRRYYMPHGDGCLSVVSPDRETARQQCADSYPGVTPEEVPELETDADAARERSPELPWDQDDIHEYDIWCLTRDPRGSALVIYGAKQNHNRPNEATIERLLAEWDDPQAIPLGNPEALQQADGIGPVRAARVAGAAAGDGLVHRVDRGRARRCGAETA